MHDARFEFYDAYARFSGALPFLGSPFECAHGSRRQVYTRDNIQPAPIRSRTRRKASNVTRLRTFFFDLFLRLEALKRVDGRGKEIEREVMPFTAVLYTRHGYHVCNRVIKNRYAITETCSQQLPRWIVLSFAGLLSSTLLLRAHVFGIAARNFSRSLYAPRIFIPISMRYEVVGEAVALCHIPSDR